MTEQDLIQEVWLPVVGFEGFYEVSNLGRVRSLERIVRRTNGTHLQKAKEMKLRFDPQGYSRVTLCTNGVARHFLVHRLVAMAFIPNPDNKPSIDHLDGCPSNNRVDNLRWVSAKENAENPVTRQRVLDARKFGPDHHNFGKPKSDEVKAKMSKTIHERGYTPEQLRVRSINSKYGRKSRGKEHYRAKKIEQYTLDGTFIRLWDCVKYAADFYGIRHSGITNNLTGRSNKCHGFIWKYANN